MTEHEQPGDELTAQRLAKLQRLRDLGLDPYPARTERTHTTAEALAAFADWEASHPRTDGPPAPQGPEVAVAGRLQRLSSMGKATFAHIEDGTGRLQLYFKRNVLGPERYSLLKELDRGDFLGARGPLFRTSTGEVTVEVHSFAILAKGLHPLPEKWHGLQDVETRFRRRYLDMIANPDVRRNLRVRSQIVAAIRQFMNSRGYIEVETPILHSTAGGAMARPFTTHHNALDQDMYLRIATELHLKRLIIGGFERVYEIGRIFRNEGVSFKHNPEFTTLESYQAYADYQDIMALVESLVATVAREVLGTTRVSYQDQTIELAPPWPRITLREAIKQHSGIDYAEHPTREALAAVMAERGVRFNPSLGRGKLIDELLSTFVEPNLIQPTFLTDYPVELSPLAKRKPDDPEHVERFEAFAGGMEIANAFSELNDPLDQRERFAEQVRQKAQGDEEADLLDEDFLTAVEYGMPPTGGLGMGIDRLAMLLTGQHSIREVIPFPTLREKKDGE